MKVSMDGLRRNLATAYTKAVSGYREAIEGNGYDDSFAGLKEGLDEMRQIIAGLMCVYSEIPDDLMTNMADDADRLPYADLVDSDDEEEAE